MIDAYLLEIKSAKYPRIIVSDKLLAALNYPIEQKRYSYPYHQYIDRFEDGCIGFHQMIYFQVIESWIEMTKDKMIESLGNIRKVIVNGLDASVEHPDIFEKLKWLKDQYNKLIILNDFDFETKTHEHIKLRIREINEGISGHNIHFAPTDKFYEERRNKKGKEKPAAGDSGPEDSPPI